MSANDLTLPLGVEEKKPVRRFARIPFGRIGIGLGVLAFAGLAAWLALVDDPLGGEPMAVAVIEPVKPPAEPAHAAVEAPKDVHAAADPQAAVPPPPAGPAGGGEARDEGGVNVVRGFAPLPENGVIIKAPDNTAGGDGKLAAVDSGLVERSKQGMLPKIGADGARPADVYARPVIMPASLKGTPPRIAILVGGMGISQNGTAEAISKLPASVTLAFAPYGTDLDRVVQRARSDGHEVMLQAPMEPFDYPNNDPGPQTLIAADPPEQNLERLHWQMSRFGGYVGVTNYMGAKFTASETALGPILKDIASRGLIYADDGTSPRSLVDQLGKPVGLASSKADIIIDATPTASAIDGALAKLEQMAREKGSAFGVATGLPVTVTRIADWSRRLEQRGILLVPVSALAKP